MTCDIICVAQPNFAAQSERPIGEFIALFLVEIVI